MFIGQKEVSSIDGAIVSFVDGTTKEYTEKSLAYLQTEEATDATAFQDLYVENVSAQVIEYLRTVDLFDASDDNVQSIQVGILAIMKENDVRIGDTKEVADLDKIMAEVGIKYTSTFQEVLKRIGYTIEDTFKRKIAQFFGTDSESHLLGEQIRNIRISDILK